MSTIPMCISCAQCQVKGLEDLLNGLFVCQTVAEYLQQSKRLLPEAVNFLTSVVGCFVKGKEGRYLASAALRRASQFHFTLPVTNSCFL